MGDLISRVEVLKIIEHIKNNRDIPKNYGTLLDMMRAIREIPTAFDVEKVVEQLKEYIPLGCNENEDLMPVCKAIEIAEGGGQG